MLEALHVMSLNRGAAGCAVEGAEAAAAQAATKQAGQPGCCAHCQAGRRPHHQGARSTCAAIPKKIQTLQRSSVSSHGKVIIDVPKQICKRILDGVELGMCCTGTRVDLVLLSQLNDVQVHGTPVKRRKSVGLAERASNEQTMPPAAPQVISH